MQCVDLLPSAWQNGIDTRDHRFTQPHCDPGRGGVQDAKDSLGRVRRVCVRNRLPLGLARVVHVRSPPPLKS